MKYLYNNTCVLWSTTEIRTKQTSTQEQNKKNSLVGMKDLMRNAVLVWSYALKETLTHSLVEFLTGALPCLPHPHLPLATPNKPVALVCLSGFWRKQHLWPKMQWFVASRRKTGSGLWLCGGPGATGSWTSFTAPLKSWDAWSLAGGQESRHLCSRVTCVWVTSEPDLDGPNLESWPPLVWSALVWPPECGD